MQITVLWIISLILTTTLSAESESESVSKLHHKILELSNDVEKCQIDLKNASLYEIFDENKKQEYLKQINDLRTKLSTLMTENKRYEALLKERNISLDTIPKPLVKTPPKKIPIEPVKTKARVCKLKEEADVYGWPEGKTVETWKKGTVFTSNIEYGDYVKVTGIFDQEYKWETNRKEEWVKKEAVTIK